MMEPLQAGGGVAQPIKPFRDRNSCRCQRITPRRVAFPATVHRIDPLEHAERKRLPS